MGYWRLHACLRGIPTNFIGDTSDPTPVFSLVCYLLKTCRRFVDEASGRYELIRGVEEVISRSGLECIRAGEAKVLGQFLVPRAEAGFRVEDIELKAGHVIVMPEAIPSPMTGDNHERAAGPQHSPSFQKRVQRRNRDVRRVGRTPTFGSVTGFLGELQGHIPGAFYLTVVCSDTAGQHGEQDSKGQARNLC